MFILKYIFKAASQFKQARFTVLDFSGVLNLDTDFGKLSHQAVISHDALLQAR